MTHRRRRRFARIALAAFALLVAALLVRYARSIDWREVAAALAAYDAGTLAAAAALSLSSYLLYCGYDLAARAYAHHALRSRQVIAIAFASYAFSLNIGAIVGGAGFRYRLYSHAGLAVGVVSRIIAFSIATNWLGYLLLAGTLFAMRGLVPPPRWYVGAATLQWLGAAMLAAVVAYLVACRLSHGRVFHVRHHHFRLPSLRLALVQLALAACNWSLMAAIVHLLMPASVAYPEVLGTLLLAAVAGVIARIPAGLGVLEAVFVALLGQEVAPARLLAALLVYRCFYYLLPLLLGLATYLALEVQARRRGNSRAAPP